MVENQIGNLTPDPSFGHNLCLKYLNGSCELILNIDIPRSFQWYKALFNPINFGPWNLLLKIWESMGTPIPKMWAHLGMCGFILLHSPTLLWAWTMTLGFHSWPTPFQAFALVASPRLGLWHKRLFCSIIIDFFHVLFYLVIVDFLHVLLCSIIIDLVDPLCVLLCLIITSIFCVLFCSVIVNFFHALFCWIY